MNDANVVHVIGHQNPDMDAIAAAIGYAWVLKAREGLNYRPARAGEINAQTTFALQRFNVPPPEVLTDAWMRVGQVAHPIRPLSVHQCLLDAARMVAAVGQAIPVVDDESRPTGLLTGSGLFATLTDLLAAPDATRLKERMDSLCSDLADHEVPIFRSEERIRDVRPLALRGKYNEFPVVDANGRYLGLVQKSDLLAPRPISLVLVDHNEPGQAIPGLEEAHIVAILDHHRLGNPPTPTPIRFKADVVGSCSTLVFEEAMEASLLPPPDVSGVLLCGLLSDTLVLRSPTTTDRDRVAATELVILAKRVPAEAPAEEREAAVASLGMELLAAGAGLGQRPADEVLTADLKTYEQGATRFAIGQVEVTGFAELDQRARELQEALEDLREREGLTLALFLVTDVVRDTSRLVAAGPKRLLDALPYPCRSDGLLDARGVVSRKKQLLPAVLAALEVS